MADSPTIAPWKLVSIGVAAGVIGGGLGLGGGFILVPLLLVLGFDRHRAHATSLAAIVLIATTGAVSFGSAGEIALGLGILVGLGGIVGSALGATVMNRLSPRVLQIVFLGLLVTVAIRMIIGATPATGSGLEGWLEVVLAIAVGLVAGFFAGIAGVGGGIVIVPAGVFLLGLTQHEAQGTSLIAVVFTAVSATVVNLRNRRVRLKDGLVVGVGGVVGSLIGTRGALALSGRTLSQIFGVVLLLVASRSIYQAFRPRAQTPAEPSS